MGTKKHGAQSVTTCKFKIRSGGKNMRASKQVFAAIVKAVTTKPKNYDDDIFAFINCHPKTEQQIVQHLGVLTDVVRSRIPALIEAKKLIEYTAHTEQRRLYLYCLPGQTDLIQQVLKPTNNHSIKQLNAKQVVVLQILQDGPAEMREIADKLGVPGHIVTKRLQVLAQATNFRPAYVRLVKRDTRYEWELIK
jgi:predicted transcriptional regulator